MTTLARLFPYVWPHRRDFLVVLVAMAATVGLEVLRPWPTKLLVDDVLGASGPTSLTAIRAWLPGAESIEGLLAWTCITTVLIVAAGAVSAMIQTVASVRAGQRMVYDLAADLFLHLQRLSVLFHSRRPVGDTMARVTGDPYGVQMFVNGVLIPLVQALATLAAMFWVMWRLHPAMTLLSLSIVPFLALAIAVFGRPMRERSRERRDLEARLMTAVERTLASIPVVQAFTREEIEQQRFRDHARATVRAYERATRADMWFKLGVGLVTAVGTAGLMWIGGRAALAGEISPGTVLVFLGYLASLYGPLNTITYMASMFQQAAAAADRVVEMMDVAPDVRERPDASEIRLTGHVRCEAVTFGYEPHRPVLRDVSFEVRPGETIAIVGPTGAGKTTLASLILRFFDPQAGRILLDGVDVRDMRVRALRRQVAIVLQESFILPLSIAENIAYGRPEATREEIVAAAAAANATDFIDRLPDGYDTIVGERGMTLSGGERQRLAIARAFLKDAPVLILDEPTAALDAATESLVLDALAKLVRGRTTLVIAHRLSTLRDADRILVLDRGALVEQGTHDALIAGGGLYAQLWRRQMRRADPEGVVV
jgi:ATP-binding cassette, subfamily B, bacterial